VAAWLARWSLIADGDGFTTRFGSLLMPVRTPDGAAAMLKIAVHEEERRGAATLAWFEGQGAVRVLARQGSALLMERAGGSTSLAQMARSGADDAACVTLCKVAAALHAPRRRPPPREAVPLERWFRALWPAATAHGGAFAKAAVAARPLLATQQDVVVLHGDLHHDNVLDAEERGWLAIDPKGLVGERAFEFANLFRNPDAETALAPRAMARRLSKVSAAAGVDRERLRSWIVAYAGLGAAWSLSSGDDPGPGLAIAEAAAALAH
jgi:streptomycin 6-kinase